MKNTHGMSGNPIISDTDNIANAQMGIFSFHQVNYFNRDYVGCYVELFSRAIESILLLSSLVSIGFKCRTTCLKFAMGASLNNIMF